MIGKRFGKLKVIDVINGRDARVRCDCGRKKTVRKGNLRSGNTRSCGNHRSKKRRPANDYVIGSVWGYLRIIDRQNSTANCRCLLCGNEHTVRATSLGAGRCRSCGCLTHVADRRRPGQKQLPLGISKRGKRYVARLKGEWLGTYRTLREAMAARR